MENSTKKILLNDRLAMVTDIFSPNEFKGTKTDNMIDELIYYSMVRKRFKIDQQFVFLLLMGIYLIFFRRVVAAGMRSGLLF